MFKWIKELFHICTPTSTTRTQKFILHMQDGSTEEKVLRIEETVCSKCSKVIKIKPKGFTE